MAPPQAGGLDANFAARLALVTFHGEQEYQGHHVSFFTDPLTGSTFSVKRGQTIGQGLTAFINRWDTIAGRP